MPPPSNFPLRWESTGDQWWYASPIDFAAANGHYDLVRELLHLDNNLLIKLSSLRRIRRLETVWDDEDHFRDVATCRSAVARKLFRECESGGGGYNSLIRARYGGWLLYTAASAGDLKFVNELLTRDPFLVFGEGEYGVTDMLYAAARSKDCEVFRVLLRSAASPPGKEVKEMNESEEGFEKEILNRAVHAAARGGNLEILKELLKDCSDVLGFRDEQGSTVLHSASGRGQIEVVKDLIATYHIVTSIDHNSNSALHIAAYRGYLPVVEALLQECPSLSTLTNVYGDTFLHTAVSGFRTPGFRRVDKQIELMNKLLTCEIVNIEEVVNLRNNDGRTALHIAVIENIQSNLIELLMTVPSIDLNIKDSDGMTPLDYLRLKPRSAASEILIKQLVSAGGLSSKARDGIVSQLRGGGHGIGMSPGTSFRISDGEIFLHTGVEYASDASVDCFSGTLTNFENSESPSRSGTGGGKVASAARKLKSLLQWPRKKAREDRVVQNHDNESSIESFHLCRSFEDCPAPLRTRYSKLSSSPSPLARRKFAAELMHGVIQAKPYFSGPIQSTSPSVVSSPASSNQGEIVSESPASSSSKSRFGKLLSHKRQASLNTKLMNQYLCFGAQGLALDADGSTKDSKTNTPRKNYRRATSLAV
ncbi:Serine/threonine-protein phosphatase 6 regulatory ankyrin repeat subunit B [Linum perenne]